MIKQLCKEIETALNHQIKTPKDFIFLRDNIYSRLHVLVSLTVSPSKIPLSKIQKLSKNIKKLSNTNNKNVTILP